MPYKEDHQKVYVINKRPIPVEDFAQSVGEGKYTGYTIFNKFGRDPAVSTTIAPISNVATYATPTDLTSLEILSSSTGDTSAGAGARSVTVIGIGANWLETSVTVATNGTTAVPLVTQFYRVYRWYVETSGTYATQSASSHIGTLTLRIASGGATWSTIGLVDGLGRGQSQIACYTVPAGKTLHMYAFDFSVDTTKSVNLYLFSRTGADVTTAPCTRMAVRRQYDGLTGVGNINFKYPMVFSAKTDVGFMGETASGTASVSVQFDGLLEDV